MYRNALFLIAGFAFAFMGTSAHAQDEQQIAVVCLSKVSFSKNGIRCSEKTLVDAKSDETPFESVRVEGLAKQFSQPTVFSVSENPSAAKLKKLSTEVIGVLNQVAEKACLDAGLEAPKDQKYLRGRYMSEGAFNSDFGSGYIKGRWTWNKESTALEVRCTPVSLRPDPTAN